MVNSDARAVGWGSRFCTSGQLPNNADAAGLRTRFCEANVKSNTGVGSVSQFSALMLGNLDIINPCVLLIPGHSSYLAAIVLFALSC